MSQDNIFTDTPDNETQHDVVGDANEQHASLEEAVFGIEAPEQGSEGNVESAFNEGTGETAASPVEQPAKQSNDEKRYQYWQSQADKMKSENESLKAQINQAPPVQPQQEFQQAQGLSNEPQQPIEEHFPAPPEKPSRPRQFSREEAYADPQSDSARYLDAVEDWRDDIAEYNTIKTQYDAAVVNEKFEAMEKQKVQEAQRFQAQQEQQAKQRQVVEHLQGHHGMNNAETQDFMSKMSDPKSINIDNLVQLYRMQNGGAPAQQQAPAQPSDAFKQVQNAQQVPSPMGVMPSGNTNNDGRSAEDRIMDAMIGNFNSKNPWK